MAGLFPMDEAGLLAYGQNLTSRPDYRWQQKLGSAAQGLMGNRDLALALLANSGYSPQRQSLGQILGTSALQAQQMGQAREQQGIENEIARARLDVLKNTRGQSPYGAIQPDKFTPESLAEFERTGKYSDLKLRSIGMQYGRYNPGDFTPDSWAQFLQSDDPSVLVRYISPQNATVTELAGGKSIVQPSRTGGAPRITPLTTAQQEQAAASAAAAAQASGKGAGEVQADIQKKGVGADAINGIIDIAEPLIDVATGSRSGAAYDTVVGWFGHAPSGAQATAQLAILQAALMMNQPRMEGPQGVLDVQLYEKMAGQIGDPKIPREQKKAALKTIRDLQNKYKQRAAAALDTGFAPRIMPNQPGPAAQPTLDDIRKKYGRQP